MTRTPDENVPKGEAMSRAGIEEAARSDAMARAHDEEARWHTPTTKKRR